MASYECDTGFACIYDDEWPFLSMCQELRGKETEKKNCHDDTDC